MTLQEVISLMNKENIPVEQVYYPDRRSFLKENFRHPNLNGKPGKPITVLRIRSENGRRHLLMHFEEQDGAWRLMDVHFGDYAFELFDETVDSIPEAIMDGIRMVQSGRAKVIVSWVNEAWDGDGLYEFSDDPGEDMSAEYERRLASLRRPQGFIGRLLARTQVYEIYDWFSYEEHVR